MERKTLSIVIICLNIKQIENVGYWKMAVRNLYTVKCRKHAGVNSEALFKLPCISKQSAEFNTIQRLPRRLKIKINGICRRGLQNWRIRWSYRKVLKSNS